MTRVSWTVFVGLLLLAVLTAIGPALSALAVCLALTPAALLVRGLWKHHRKPDTIVA